MKTYNVALVSGIDYDQFWNEIETDGSGSTYVPERSVNIINERPTSLRQCWYELSDEEATKLRNDPRVQFVEIPPEHRSDIEFRIGATQQGLYYKATGTNPTNTMGINWGLFRMNSTTNNTTGTSGTLNYDYPLDGTGVDVVIMDSGCQADHPDFFDSYGTSRVQLIDWYAAAGMSGVMPSDFYQDAYGHGTHCAGISAGKTYGRAKNSKIYIMHIQLTGIPGSGIDITTAFDLIKGWHINKPIDPVLGYKRPTVVNMSWGAVGSFTNIVSVTYRGTTTVTNSKIAAYGMIGDASNYFGQINDSVQADVEEMAALGIISVSAAGNYSQTNDVPGGLDFGNYFSASDIFGQITSRFYMRGSSPGSAPSTICVGNIDVTDSPQYKNTSSDSGPRIDVWAPGTNIVSTVSNTNAFGGTAKYPFNNRYLICSISGTSMASPQIAGLAAQLLQVYPTATPAQIKQKIIDLSTANVLYSTGLTTDYANSRSLHGAPNRYAYQSFNTVENGSITGNVSMSGNTNFLGQ